MNHFLCGFFFLRSLFGGGKTWLIRLPFAVPTPCINTCPGIWLIIQEPFHGISFKSTSGGTAGALVNPV
jgi:hypothetical protein